MQELKSRFEAQDKGHHSSIQACIRTQDLHLIGDGSHLTSFNMIGNFSFGNGDYDDSVVMWHKILVSLDADVTHVTVHPTQTQLQKLWQSLGRTVVLDESCTWSDGQVGGYCSEVFHGDLELGNLVNPMGHSVDVGFGLERLVQVLEGRARVDDTSLFSDGHPIAKDHLRTLALMRENGVRPGSKGQSYICRQLVRRISTLVDGPTHCDDWIEEDRDLLRRRRLEMERYRGQFMDKPWTYWKSTFGWTKEEILEFLA